MKYIGQYLRVKILKFCFLIKLFISNLNFLILNLFINDKCIYAEETIWVGTRIDIEEIFFCIPGITTFKALTQDVFEIRLR